MVILRRGGKHMKKIVYLTCIMLLFSIISSSGLGTTKANAMETTNLNSNDNYEIEYLENTDVYQKIKITNKETGEIEYLEVDLLNKEYRAIYNDKQTEQQTEVLITREEDSIVIENLTTNETRTEKTFNLSDENPVTRALPGGNGEYELYYTFTGSKSLIDDGAATLSVILGILASIYGGPIVGVLTTIGTYLLTADATKFYYIRELYYFRGAPSKPASFVRYYEKSNFTGHLGDVYYNFIY